MNIHDKIPYIRKGIFRETINLFADDKETCLYLRFNSPYTLFSISDVAPKILVPSITLDMEKVDNYLKQVYDLNYIRKWSTPIYINNIRVLMNYHEYLFGKASMNEIITILKLRGY